jgi:hypothetical protein
MIEIFARNVCYLKKLTVVTAATKNIATSYSAATHPHRN